MSKNIEESQVLENRKEVDFDLDVYAETLSPGRQDGVTTSKMVVQMQNHVKDLEHNYQAEFLKIHNEYENQISQIRQDYDTKLTEVTTELDKSRIQVSSLTNDLHTLKNLPEDITHDTKRELAEEIYQIFQNLRNFYESKLKEKEQEI